MYLVNIHTLRLQKFGENPPPYATLSHRWTDEETTYEEFIDDNRRKGAGFEKIQNFCSLLKDGLDPRYRWVEGEYVQSDEWVQWCWVDTCCIDKRSSAELSEAVNSMAMIYKRSAFCVALLNDVEVVDDAPQERWEDQLWESEWFKRGWTLQELLFPPRVFFYDKYWTQIPGFDTEQVEARNLLSEFTNIPSDCFGGGSNLSIHSVATRMAWASNRSTTRVEDRAYSLLGIFKINMPLLYGEGENAFYRLQEHIIGKYDDETILCWASDSAPEHSPVLTSSPDDFCKEGVYSLPVALWTRRPLRVTSRGLEIEAEASQIISLTEKWKYEIIVIPLNAFSPFENGGKHSWYITLASPKGESDWYRIGANRYVDQVWNDIAGWEDVALRKLPTATYYLNTWNQTGVHRRYPKDHALLKNLITFEQLISRLAVLDDGLDKRNATGTTESERSSAVLPCDDSDGKLTTTETSHQRFGNGRIKRLEDFIKKSPTMIVGRNLVSSKQGNNESNISGKKEVNS